MLEIESKKPSPSPQMICSKGHTLPLDADTTCYKRGCRDYFSNGRLGCNWLVEPSPARCEHIWKIYHTEDADQVLIKCSQCGEPYYEPSQPEPIPQSKMPLITLSNQDDMYTLGRKYGATQQRDADMAWHLEKVQQVRKDFAQEIDDWIERQNWRLTSEWGLCSSTIRNTIRAMVKEVADD